MATPVSLHAAWYGRIFEASMRLDMAKLNAITTTLIIMHGRILRDTLTNQWASETPNCNLEVSLINTKLQDRRYQKGWYDVAPCLATCMYIRDREAEKGRYLG